MSTFERPDGGMFLIDATTGQTVGFKQADGTEHFFPFVTAQPASYPAIVPGGASIIAAYDALNVKGADIASATTTDIGAATGPYVHVTGTVTITGLGTVAAGTYREVKFTGILALTHNGTSLILPGAANITTAANDTAAFRSLGSGNWVCLWYKRASGLIVGTANTSQIVGTATNDDAAAGTLGEYAECCTNETTATVTITIATPGVVTWTTHGLSAGALVQFTTTDTLPTGITADTPYYVLAADLADDTFKISATPGGTAIDTTGSQAGVHTGLSAVPMTTTTVHNLAALNLLAGDYWVGGNVNVQAASGTLITVAQAGINTSSATAPTAATQKGAWSIINAPFGATARLVLPTSVRRVSLAAPGIVYLLGRMTFTVSTLIGGGFLWAERRR